MVEILDCRTEVGSERLGQILESGGCSAILLKGYGSLPAIQRLPLKQQVRRIWAEAGYLTGLDEQLTPIGTDLPLTAWDQLELESSMAHLLVKQGISAGDRLAQLQRLVWIVAQLRAPDGCPWDRAQTPESLTPYVIEEAYETAAALRSGDPQQIVDELGDLLLQIVLQSQIFAERGAFDLGQVAEGISDKLIRRHPHVFGPEAGSDLSGEGLHRRWEEIKQAETPEQSLGDKMLHYADSLPPLMAALKISRRAARAGFEWPQIEGVWAKLAEEEQELREILGQPLEGRSEAEQAAIRRQQAAELGDLVFTVVNLGRWYGIDPAEALQETNRRFAHRIQAMEQLTDTGDLSGRPIEELEDLWQRAKQQFPY